MKKTTKPGGEPPVEDPDGENADPDPKPAKGNKADTVEDDILYPTVVYKKHPVDDKHVNGYETRTVDSAADLAKIGKGWVHSPDEI